jgi:serine/threonine protein kinase
MPFGEGSVLGHRYRLLSQVGRGGMGRVWHAHDDLLHRDVAVKEVIFPPGLTQSDREILYERTLREARSAARLSHPGIVTVHDVVEEDGRPWIVMEFVRARSLQEVIDRDGRLPPVQVAEIGGQMLAALRVAHASGVLHRDVKPANVLLDTAPGRHATRVVITDFGIARMEGEANLTQTGIVLGSPAYIAPERARGEPATPASDLWALGATLYAACEGRSPHDRDEAMAALTAVLHEEPDPPRHAGPLGPLLLGLLAKDPQRRVGAERAAEDLSRTARGETMSGSGETVHDIPEALTLPAPAPGPSTQPPPPTAPRKVKPKVLLIVAAVVAVVVAVSAATLVMNGDNGHSDPKPPIDKTRTPSATPTPTPTPSPTVPAGFHRQTGPGGASMFVPLGWARQELSRDSVRWTQPGTGAHIQVDAIPWGTADPVAHWRQWQSEVASQHVLPDYHLISLGDRYVANGWPGADIQYTWLTRSSGTLRAYDRGFTANGHQYAILVAGPAAQWPRYAGLVKTTFDSFKPSPA